VTIRQFHDDHVLEFLGHLSKSTAKIIRLSITLDPTCPSSTTMYTEVVAKYPWLHSLYISHPCIVDEEKRHLAMDTLRILQDMEEFGWGGVMMVSLRMMRRIMMCSAQII